MRPPIFAPSIIRLSGRPRPEPNDSTRMPPGRKGRPHPDRTVEAVRKLIEGTTLTYDQIAARTGASPASISRWMQAGEWKRPPFAPFAMDTVPTPRASVRLRCRRLAARLLALADRAVRELEEAPTVDLQKLAEALELNKMARLAALRRTPSRAEAAMWGELMHPMIELCAVGVDLHRAPRAAVQDFLENRAEPPAHQKPPRSRGRGTKRYLTQAQRHRRMLERE